MKVGIKEQIEIFKKMQESLGCDCEVRYSHSHAETIHIMVESRGRRLADYWPSKGTLGLNRRYAKDVSADEAIDAILSGIAPESKPERQDVVVNKPNPYGITVEHYPPPPGGYPPRHPIPEWAVVGPPDEIPPWENLPSPTSLATSD